MTSCKLRKFSIHYRVWIWTLLLLAGAIMTACTVVTPTPTPTVPPQTDLSAERADSLENRFTRPAEVVGDLIVKAAGVETALEQVGDQGVRLTESAGEETRATLDEFQANNEKTIRLLGEEYQDNLEITIDSLDAGTQAILRNIDESLTTVNALLQDDALLLTESSIEIIEATSQELRQNIELLEQSLGNTVVLAGETSAYVIDEASNDMLAILSVLMLGLGGLLCIYLFYRYQLPESWLRYVVIALMVVYFLFFLILALSPGARAFVLSSVLSAPSP